MHVLADASSLFLKSCFLQNSLLKRRSQLRKYLDRSPYVRNDTPKQKNRSLHSPAWACERLADCLTGIKFHIQTDHKPLVSLFSTIEPLGITCSGAMISNENDKGLFFNLPCSRHSTCHIADTLS